MDLLFGLLFRIKVPTSLLFGLLFRIKVPTRVPKIVHSDPCSYSNGASVDPTFDDQNVPPHSFQVL